MTLIGSIPNKIWSLVLDTAKKEAYPVEQDPTCPYVILHHVSERQCMVLTGQLKRQQIDLYIEDVYPPDAEKNFIPPPVAMRHNVELLAWTLISKSLVLFLDTSSIIT